MPFPTTDTLSSIIDEVILSLVGFSAQGDQITTLSADISSGDSTFTFGSEADVSTGIVEIDQELMYVTSVSSGIASVKRGWRGTAPAAHTAGALIYVAPLYPRAVVAREVQNQIRALYPDLFAVKTTDLTVSASSWQYEVPAGVDRILSAEWRWDTLTGWHPLTQWELVQSAYSADFASGKYLSVNESLPVGAKIHVTYAAAPTLLTNPSDGFAAVTGLPASTRDVVVLGTASRLLPWVDTQRTTVQSVPSDALDNARQIGTAVSLARELRTRYQDRLAAERRALYERYPTRAHRTR